MKKIFIFLISFSIVYANNLSDEEMLLSSLDIEKEFLSSLDEVSEIATKTKLNIDDTPSFVTVLQSKKLKKLGITNVFEALSLVPGVQLTKEITGVPVVVFRGVSQKSEVKLMIDGVTINNSYRGSIYYYLDFPIEMIERIEIIRGAGSVLYGSGAISGVINIITHTSEYNLQNKAFISKATYNTNKGGLNISKTIGDLKVSLDGYYQSSDKKIYVDSNPSAYSGDSDRHLKDYSIGSNIVYGDFSLLSRIKKSNTGNAYGLFGALDTDEDKNYIINNSFFSKLSYKKNLSKYNKLSVSAGYTMYKQEADINHPSTFINSTYKEDSYILESNLISTYIKNNELLLGIQFESAKTLKSEWSTVIPYISKPNLNRKTTSVYLNDNYFVSENLEISAGLRYDHYSDFGDSYSPNLGMVYRINEKIKLKTLYSNAYRAPSWIELTSNSTLEAEKSKSIEAGIVYKNDFQNLLRLNFYISEIDDLIAKDSTGKYVQDQKNKFTGSELEYIYTPNIQTQITLSASCINTEDSSGNELVDVAKRLASTSLRYELNSGITIGSLLKYVSGSKRSDTDTRENMKSGLIYDQTISYSYKEITANLIIKDLFDSKTRFALPSNVYEQDFDDGGRSFILKASIQF